ncbi:methyl-accepting chemotaxis protein [Paenibacillus crassostreae]|uniref:Chemotaxis protein n=1 Tax=Paenibacillus crassostreae TaxID=1763538 RepID=A0A162KU77_9BACL|nr:methyl-accepting chemotaxis protein [Paenibacillus crassostreae]AOZ93126.1 methyl-accepting chemotaxis protein [Paenibacillus crassostreae]OAB71785.1 chemotaxis protein [Paenibacillus crassostreae]
MFEWLGFKTGLPLWWSYRLNQHMKNDIEEIFEGIAFTRMDILKDWVDEYWSHLERLLGQMVSNGLYADHYKDSGYLLDSLFAASRKRGIAFSEIFLLDQNRNVTFSTYSNHIGMQYSDDAEITKAIQHSSYDKKCLLGPYADPLTLEIGPSTSRFHDEMTLLYIVPIVEKGVWKGALCGRVPNDVLGDLIQRESGHVYPDSGDNYIFMAKPNLNKGITPGTALSRSRFEDVTFTHGDNLKEGIHTDFGMVQVQQHTELELIFKDPATGELHPGVANTIRNGSNLFVEFPGYSDYRHIPVIGKGVTFQLPHCPDVWGMMCEGDLEEVYRIRSIGWKIKKMNMMSALCFVALNILMYVIMSNMDSVVLGATVVGIVNILLGYTIQSISEGKANKPIVRNMSRLNQFVRLNAEGKGDLTKRLPIQEFSNDETRELAKWINNMIDSLEGIMLKVKYAAEDVIHSQELLKESTASTESSTNRVSGKILLMIRGIRSQLKDIDVAKDVSLHMSDTLRELEQSATNQIAIAQEEVEHIGDKMHQIKFKVEESNRTIRDFLDTTQNISKVLQSIEEISAQTHLLSLNASIEAAHAGEHGRGFAIVADEIRKLAELTNGSTTQIKDIISTINRQVEIAFQYMGEGSETVIEGNNMVASAKEILSNANSHDTQKTKVVDEVVALMEKIATVSIDNRKISADVEQTVQDLQTDVVHARSTSENVDSITQSLLQMVNQFQLTDRTQR